MNSKRINSTETFSAKKPKSQGSFSSLPLDKKLIETLENDMKYTEMTLVQEMTVEILLGGKDLHILSRTGSGKTAAFLVPSIQILLTAPQSNKSIKLLCISPTRELALQIAKEAELMTKNLNLHVGVAIGGTNIKTEKNAMDSGLDILVATPGRLLDHLSNKSNLLNGVGILVLDECDRLLDMGFGPDVNKIMAFSPKQRQSILCSGKAYNLSF
jgi:superfamily II DNA/RNA helicase